MRHLKCSSEALEMQWIKNVADLIRRLNHHSSLAANDTHRISAIGNDKYQKRSSGKILKLQSVVNYVLVLIVLKERINLHLQRRVYYLIWMICPIQENGWKNLGHVQEVERYFVNVILNKEKKPVEKFFPAEEV